MTRAPHTSRPPMAYVSAETILKKDYPPLSWIVEGLIPEGFTVLAGRQKLGKSTLALHIGRSVALGKPLFGRPVEKPGSVLYFDLENGEARIQRRLLEAGDRDEVPHGLTFGMEAPKVNNGFVEELDQWQSESPDLRLVVIDVLQRVKPSGRTNLNAYENDYAIWSPLQTWSRRKKVAVLGLHHTRKAMSLDPLESLSGSNGLPSCADTCLLMDMMGERRSLYVRGRDVDEASYLLEKCGNELLLSPLEAQDEPAGTTRTIEQFLKELSRAASAREIQAGTGIPDYALRKALRRMYKSGAVHWAGHGHYEIRRASVN